MITVEHEDFLDMLPAVDLDGLNAAAALTTRRDRKYVAPLDLVARAVGALGAGTSALEIDGSRRFEYETSYFDTEGFDLYLAAARSRPRRHKVRTRSYLDSEETSLEINMRDGRRRTVKHRFHHAFPSRHHLDHRARRIVELVTGIDGEGDALERVLTTRYARRTLLLPGRVGRATVDTGYRCGTPSGRGAYLPDLAIVETKSDGKPGPLDHALWALGCRPVKISKFGTGLAATSGGMPANKWHRVIPRLVTA